ncbi:hypothetical protein AB0B85_27980 [Micromonospora sp. NPDC049044]|uniref:hypothetical protein n=1 Tax=unclassified Micromonospora TaxID=2617518 RepID=UPI00340DD497
MDNDIQLISDGDGLAVIGHPAAVDRFLSTERLPSKDLGLQRLSSALRTGSTIAKGGSEIAEHSGRWVQLTAESAQAMKKYKLMTGSENGVSRAVLTDHGKINGLLEVVRTPSALLTNPAILTGAAGLMAQLAMQQTMDEITDYLAVIDAKVDAVLRAQTDAVVADMIGAELVIDEALTIRQQVGRVSEITWSKVQAAPVQLARTQVYALRQLDAIAERLETQTKVGDLAKTSMAAEIKVQEWLAVLARCFQLQDAVAVLELDRVLDAAPGELEEHRVAIRAARRNRLELISRSTDRLIARMDAAAGTANAKVLLNPTTSRAVVRSANHVATTVVDFHTRLGLGRDRQSWNARRWLDAAVDVRDRVLDTGTEVRDRVLDAGTEVGDKVRETGSEGVGAAGRLGVAAFGRARRMMGKASDGIAERAQRQLGSREES